MKSFLARTLRYIAQGQLPYFGVSHDLDQCCGFMTINMWVSWEDTRYTLNQGCPPWVDDVSWLF
jgi:hypothetical protein